jgi:hypothetical protein
VKTVCSRRLVGLGIIATLAVLGLSLSGRGHDRSQMREIVLVARAMRFYVDGTTAANPTLHVRTGDQIRLTVRNDNPGLIHDLVIDSLRVVILPLKAGEVRSIDVRIPDTPGRYEYYCRPHALMMRGELYVTRD